MGLTVDTKVTGADRLASTSAAAARDIADMPARVHAEAAQVVADEVRRVTPHRTGYLARSITPTPSSGGATITARASYAAPVNYGSKRNRPPARFMERGLDAGTEPAAEVYQEAVDKALSKVKGA